MTQNGLNDSHASSMIPTIVPPPSDPLRNPVSSETYIKSLEQKLNKMKGGAKEPTSKEILKSLEKVKTDQMAHLMQGNHSSLDIDYKGSVLNKSHCGKEHSVEELVALVYQDELNGTQTNSTSSSNMDSGKHTIDSSKN